LSQGPKIDDSEMDTRAASIPLVSNQWNIVPTDDVENGNCQKQSSLYRYNCKGNNQTHFTENPLRYIVRNNQHPQFKMEKTTTEEFVYLYNFGEVVSSIKQLIKLETSINKKKSQILQGNLRTHKYLKENIL